MAEKLLLRCRRGGGGMRVGCFSEFVGLMRGALGVRGLQTLAEGWGVPVRELRRLWRVSHRVADLGLGCGRLRSRTDIATQVGHQIQFPPAWFPIYIIARLQHYKSPLTQNTRVYLISKQDSKTGIYQYQHIATLWIVAILLLHGYAVCASFVPRLGTRPLHVHVNYSILNTES